MGRFFAVGIALAVASLALGQTPSAGSKKNLTPGDYGGWESLSGARISNDGRWLAYGIRLVDGDGRVTVRNNDTKDQWEIPSAVTAKFSMDSKWCAYLMVPPKQVVDAMRAANKPVEPKLGLRDLTTGVEKVFDHVSDFRMLKSSPTLLITKMRGPSKLAGGSDLEVVNLSTGDTLTIGNVATASLNAAEDLILLKVESDSQERGVQLLEPATGTLKTLAWGTDDVQGLTWASKAEVAAFLLGKPDEKKTGAFYRVEIASNLRTAHPGVYILDPSTRPEFPKGQRIVPYYGVDLSADGNGVAFGLQPWTDAVKDDRKPEDRSNVLIWNTHDVRVMPTQIVHAGGDRQRSDLYIWRAKENVIKPVSVGDTQSGFPLGNFDKAIVMDDKPYRSAVTNGYSYADLFLLDPWTGAKTPVAQKTHWADSIVPSPGGKYVAYYAARNWWLLDVTTGKSVDETSKLPNGFEASEDDHVIPEKPFAAQPVWLKDDSGVLLGDDYDEFLVRPGTAGITNLTHGRSDRRVFRFVPVGDDPEGPALGDPLYFHVMDKDTKAAGFAVSDGAAPAKTLFIDNVTIGGLHKALNADRMMFIMGSFTKSPDAYVTNTGFTAAKPVTHTNPQQVAFNWGHSELINYKSRWGVPLQGSLIYPADYVKGKRYPMVLYIYERLSDGLNQYVVPDPLDPYNAQILSQNGYFVLMPDIAYRGRHRPGEDAVDCVEPAITAVLAKDLGVDAARVGLMGHSWGAYQTAFVTTVSKMFAVGVAGAPLTELTSMYNSFYWNSGAADQESFETGQGRMGVPFWDDPKPYIDDSPVWRSKERRAPLLFAAGDADGAVDWHQSLYLYNTLRRLGKDAVLLVYPGENHGLVRPAVRKDYAARARHYLDVYLKGVKPESWITQGVPFIHQEDNP